ncbi:MAG: ATP-binding cassette domain-containing protein [Kiloniellales bacterium]|nr:ATP-binding cassette domain-containing protein [Kiloniellales bacterium]
MSLALEQVGKTVGSETHLRDITLELAPGSLNVLLGPTLAGKTSLMRIMAGLDRPTSGRLLLDGRDVEFYRSPARVAWTPSGTNVPDYPKLAQLWWQNIGEAVAGEVTVDTAMDNLAREQDKVLRRLQRSNVQGDCGPKLNDEIDPEKWLSQAGSPKAKLANEKPQGETVDYDQLIQAWREGRVK